MGNSSSSNYPGAAAAASRRGNYPRQPSQSAAASSSGHSTTAPVPPPRDRAPQVNGSRPASVSSRPQSRSMPSSGRPGAYSVPGPGRGAGGGDSTPYTVVVPANVRPGQQFQVMAGGVPMMVTCPPQVSSGDHIIVMVPRQPAAHQRTGAGQVYMATVPSGVRGGGEFNIMVNGVPVTVTCPEGMRPGDSIRIRLPEEPSPSTLHQTFEVTVPQGVRPGQPFALIANGQRVMVHCPPDARPGQKIRFRLPIQLSESQLETYNIHYNKDGWVRCVGTDLRFHWVLHEENPDSSGGGGNAGSPSRRLVGGETAKKLESLSFIRSLQKHGRHWSLTADNPAKISLDASVPEANLTFQHLSRVSGLPFQEKVRWFQTQCEVLRVPWDVEHQHIKVRRESLLDDSMHAIESIRPDQMRQRFRFEFINEPGIDAGGVAREFFHLCSEQLFNPNFALFHYSAINQMCMQINPSSGIANDEHLQYFHTAGRILSKALFDGQLVQAHLVRPLYKHLLGWPIAFSDLEHLDNYMHDSLAKMTELEDVEVCALDFTVTEERMGERLVVELKPGGEDIPITNENMWEYLELIMKHRLLMRVSEQLTAFLVGFYEVIPEALLSVFDFQELELLMCGLPTIDLEDWKSNTIYGGELERKGDQHKVVKWWWEVLEEFSDEQRARLLQFVTGTSGVPSQGFAVLQGNDGNIRRFTITGMPLSQGIFPRGHTCFNRINLPLYNSKEDLRQYVTLAINMENTGFDIE